MDRADPESTEPPETDGVDVADVLDQLGELEETITTPEQREELHDARNMLEGLPGAHRLGDRISMYTSRDLGEAVVGSIIFALPLLVEDGVFHIADYFVETRVAGVPVLLVGNVVFVVCLTAGLIYAVDFRDVAITNPIVGILPRRLVGTLAVSFVTTALLMAMWGRLIAGDPARTTMFARVTVVWAAAALGASLGDILPGESKGTDLTLENLDDIVTVDD